MPGKRCESKRRIPGTGISIRQQPRNARYSKCEARQSRGLPPHLLLVTGAARVPLARVLARVRVHAELEAQAVDVVTQSLCVGVCVCVRARTCGRARVYVGVRMCVYVCMCVWPRNCGLYVHCRSQRLSNTTGPNTARRPLRCPAAGAVPNLHAGRELVRERYNAARGVVALLHPAVIWVSSSRDSGAALSSPQSARHVRTSHALSQVMQRSMHRLKALPPHKRTSGTLTHSPPPTRRRQRPAALALASRQSPPACFRVALAAHLC